MKKVYGIIKQIYVYLRSGLRNRKENRNMEIKKKKKT